MIFKTVPQLLLVKLISFMDSFLGTCSSSIYSASQVYIYNTIVLQYGRPLKDK